MKDMKCFLLSVLILSSYATQALAYYNPANGRWLSRDPIEERGGRNLYGYLFNDPIMRVDPLGQLALCDAIFDSCLECKCYGPRKSTIDRTTWCTTFKSKCENDLSPSVVKMAVEKALQELGISGVTPQNGSSMKAQITQQDWQKIQSSGKEIKGGITISADSAKRIDLGNGMELKIYFNADGTIEADVGYGTYGMKHAKDAYQYKKGENPNPNNAEDYLNMAVVNMPNLQLLEKFNACTGQ